MSAKKELNQAPVQIRNCFDSHTHFLATGQVHSGLRLHGVSSFDELKSIIVQPQYYQADWIVGFGWDQHKLFSSPRWPTKFELDAIFPNDPVYLSRVDGHTGWFNSRAEKKFVELGFDFNNSVFSDHVVREDGNPIGILTDRAHVEALKILPAPTEAQFEASVVCAAQTFNRAGFTHVRDMSSSLKLWSSLDRLLEARKVSICLEGNITIEDVQELESGLTQLESLRKIKNPYLRAKGLKIFIDGSLGSKTAAISQPYLGVTPADHGQLFWTQADIEKVLRCAWQNEAELSCHVIGDQAVDLVVKAARNVSATGLLGRINLEHTQLVRPETIQNMKPLHVRCHMQPCHWLSDRLWLSSTITEDLFQNAFPWAQFLKNKISVQFGSDSPIEPPSLKNNLAAVLDLNSTRRQKLEPSEVFKLHQHPDSKWTDSVTEIAADGTVQSVLFDGQLVVL